MNTFGMVAATLGAIALLSVPRRWAVIVFLLLLCNLGGGSGLEIGVAHWPLYRLIILASILRVIVRGEKQPGGVIGLDWWVIAWAGWALFSSVFHEEPGAEFVNKTGEVFDFVGSYFALRSQMAEYDALKRLPIALLLALFPIALGMCYENITVTNPYGLVGLGRLTPIIRDGRVRSQGPFLHPILAGTVAGTSLPLFLSAARTNTVLGVAGTGTCLVMLATCAASGPIMSGVFGVAALAMWRFRKDLQGIRRAAIGFYLLADLLMKDPAYYLMMKIDLTGSSTGWHRAELIHQSIVHLREWWLGGTDYTRHWMPTGVTWSEKHTDITNQYIHMGVAGGLPMMLLFMGCVWTGFRYIGKSLRATKEAGATDGFQVWTVGAVMFSHACTFLSVRYFDQSVVLIYLALAATACAVTTRNEGEKGEEVAKTHRSERGWWPDGGMGCEAVSRRGGAVI